MKSGTKIVTRVKNHDGGDSDCTQAIDFGTVTQQAFLMSAVPSDAMGVAIRLSYGTDARSRGEESEYQSDRGNASLRNADTEERSWGQTPDWGVHP